jgi:uncharacterized protein YuzE
MKAVKYDYDKGLDSLHIYTSEIDSGIKGGLSYGNFNIDIGIDNKIIGIELEGASSLLNMAPDILSKLDDVALIVRKSGNILFIGFTVARGEKKSTIQVNIPTQKIPVSVVS